MSQNNGPLKSPGVSYQKWSDFFEGLPWWYLVWDIRFLGVSGAFLLLRHTIGVGTGCFNSDPCADVFTRILTKSSWWQKHRWISPKTSRFTRVPACSWNPCHSFPPSILRFNCGSVYLLQRKRIPQSISGPEFYHRRGTRRKRLRWPPHLSQAPHISSGRQFHKW